MTTLAQNYFTGAVYQGQNQADLLGTARLNDYQENQWATYRQWQEGGYQVQKGEKGTPIMALGKKDDDDTKVSVRYYRVFNISQTKPIETDNEEGKK